MTSPHMLDALDEASDTLETPPQVFTPGSPSRLRPRNPPSMAICWITSRIVGGNRDGFLRQNVGAFPFVGGMQCGGFEVGVSASQTNQVCQAPSHHHVDGQGALDLGNTRQLQGFDPAAVLEHLDEGFDLPAAAIQVDEFGGCRQGVGRAIGEQLPFDQIGVGDDAPASGRACRRSFMGVSFDSPRSPPGSVTKPSSNAPDFCAAAIAWATRWWAHPAVAADEVLGLGLARRGGLQPLRDLLVAHAFVVPEHAAVGGTGSPPRA